jgi:hypothetical protein
MDLHPAIGAVKAPGCLVAARFLHTDVNQGAFRALKNDINGLPAEHHTRTSLKRVRPKEKSVAGSYGCPVAIEFVAKAQGDHIHVLADPVGRTGKQGVRDRERVV